MVGLIVQASIMLTVFGFGLTATWADATYLLRRLLLLLRAVLSMNVVMPIIGLAVGHLFGGPLAGDRTSLALSTASRHPAVALAIATSGPLRDPKPELAIILLSLVVATLVSIPYQKWPHARPAGRSVDRPQRPAPQSVTVSL
jgi:BASS family bile acid:Na+ symporter